MFIMEHIEMYLINVGFYTMYILSKWIQLRYGGKCEEFLRTFTIKICNHKKNRLEVELLCSCSSNM